MKNTIIKPSRARAVGVITPPLADMLALDEEVQTNHFHDVRVQRSNDEMSIYKGTSRNTQTIMGDKLEVNIVVDQVTFYKEHPEQGWFGLSVYVAGTDTRVNRGNLKIYVRDVDGIMDADVLIKEYNIGDSISLGWQIGNLNWNDVLAAFTAKNTHPFRCFNVKVVYTDSTHYYRNKTVYPPRRICYATRPVVNIATSLLANGEGDPVISNGTIIDLTTSHLAEKSFTLHSNQDTIELDFTVKDGLGEAIPNIPYKVSVQDTQEAHTIDGTAYGVSGDMYLGESYEKDETTGLVTTNNIGWGVWQWRIPPGFLDTTVARNRRHIFTSLFIPKNACLFPGGEGIRADNGVEYRVMWTYRQPVVFKGSTDSSEYDDLSTYAIRNFHYIFDVVDAFNGQVPTSVKVAVNGVTLKDENNVQRLFNRVNLNGAMLFDVEFDWKYLHAGANTVTLKCISNYDYAGEIDISCNLPFLHYNISEPTITGSWGSAGRITIEYVVGTIENDELPSCEVWDLKLNDETLVARDKTMIGGEWNGEYNSIVGLKASALINSSYNTSTGVLSMTFDVRELEEGHYDLKLVLPATDAIAGGSHTNHIYSNGGGVIVDNRTATTLTIISAHAGGGGSIGFQVKLTDDNNTNLAGKPIKFYLDDTLKATRNTNTKGIGTLAIAGGGSSGEHTLKAEFEGDDTYQPATVTTTITVE